MATTAERMAKIEECIARHDSWVELLKAEGLDACHAESFLEELESVLARLQQMAPDDKVTDMGWGCMNSYCLVAGICRGIWRTDHEGPTLYVLEERCKTCVR